MSWKVIVPNKVKRLIASWNLSRKLHLQVYDRLLIVLPQNADTLLLERVVPLQAFAYRFVLDDPDRFPHRYQFFFAVDREDAQQELRIVGGHYSTEAAETN